MERELEKLHKLKQIELRTEEVSLLRSRLVHAVRKTPVETQTMFETFVSHGLRIALSSFIFLILIGGSVSALADSSLPGDPFYNVKLNFNERVKAMLVGKTPEEQIAFQQERIETRLKEIQLLADTQTLTKEKSAVAQQALSKHTTKLSTELSTLSAQKPEEALKVTAKLEQTLRIQKDTLESAIPEARNSQKKVLLQAVDTTIASVVEQEQRIIDTELSKIEDEIIGAEPIEDISNVLIPEEALPEPTTNTIPTTITPLEP